MPLNPKTLKAIEKFEERSKRALLGGDDTLGEGRISTRVAAHLGDDDGEDFRPDANARRPRSFAEIDTAAVYAKFNKRAAPVNVMDDDGED